SISERFLLSASPLGGGRFRRAVTGARDSAFEGVMMARHSKTSAVAKWPRRIFATVLVLAVLAAAGVASIALIQGTWQVNPVLTGSMRPGLSVGGVVISERIPVDKLVLRDVMVFASPDDPANLIVHRIVSLSNNKSGQ